MHRDPLGDADPDGGDLLVAGAPVGGCAADPDAGAAVDAVRRDVEVGEEGDERVLEAAHVGHDVEGLGQPHDRVADELPRPVPGDASAAVDVDDGRAVARPVLRLGASPRGVHAGVLEEDDGVLRPARDDVGMQGTLTLEGLDVRHGVGA